MDNGRIVRMEIRKACSGIRTLDVMLIVVKIEEREYSDYKVAIRRRMGCEIVDNAATFIEW